MPDIISAERILLKEAIDLILINNDDIATSISILELLSRRCRIDQIPIVTLLESITEETCTQLYETGFLECFDLSITKRQLEAKLIRLAKFRRNCLSDNDKVRYLQIRTEELSNQLVNSENQIDEIRTRLKFENLKRKELEHINFVINRSLMTISAGNSALVEAKSEKQLAQAMCDALVKHAKYTAAWVGFINKDNQNKLDIVAQSSINESGDAVSLHCKQSRFGCRSVAHAITSNITIINSNISTKQSCESCWEDTRQHNYNSTISLPLEAGSRVIGVLNLSTLVGSAITHDEMEMLKEVAGDLSFGIDTLRIRQERNDLFDELDRENQLLEETIAKRTLSLQETNTKLMELDTLKSLFIAAMSHELRTPLNSIIGFTGIVLKGMSGELTEKQRDQLSRAYGSAKHLLELIVNVIDIAKIDGHRIELYPQNFVLNEIIEEVLQQYQKLADDKNLSVSLNIDKNIEMHSDRKRVFQSIQNIISNAVKYTEKGKILIDATINDNKVRISVKDTGIGIAENHIDDCFQAFERLPTHLKIKSGGAGLGLYLTRKLVVSLLQGEIEVESKLGVG
ncbi:MAG: GAF domain-containing sensor histidine kinase, partial [Gammaproteobacteria bacterium]|nr:GAF domain-containing sensor histidine kinase [Gammaproteobacteria bacterium]